MTDKIPDRVTMTPVTSSQIKAIGHDAQENHLYVEFHPGKKTPEKPGSVYRYGGIEAAHHNALLGVDADGKAVDGHSIGSHFGRHIKGNPEAHPFTRLNMEED
jgi:hypothetical protein